MINKLTHPWDKKPCTTNHHDIWVEFLNSFNNKSKKCSLSLEYLNVQFLPIKGNTFKSRRSSRQRTNKFAVSVKFYIIYICRQSLLFSSVHSWNRTGTRNQVVWWPLQSVKCCENHIHKMSSSKKIVPNNTVKAFKFIDDKTFGRKLLAIFQFSNLSLIKAVFNQTWPLYIGIGLKIERPWDHAINRETGHRVTHQR